MIKYLNKIFHLGETTKSFVKLVLDFLSITFIFLYCDNSSSLDPLIFIPLFAMLGLLINYKSKFYHLSVKNIGNEINTKSLHIIILLGLFIFIFNFSGITNINIVLFLLIYYFYLIWSRLAAQNLLIFNKDLFFKKKENVLIYGAGVAGTRLSLFLANDSRFNILGFVDDNLSAKGKTANNKIIYHSNELNNLIKDLKINTILFAIPSISNERKISILKFLNNFEVNIYTIPSLDEIVLGKSFGELNEININDLLQRNAIKPDCNLLTNAVFGKSILIVGAGGSIGSEIARKIIIQ